MRFLTVSAALLGAADTSLFLSRRLRLFDDHPGRAAGSVLGLALWSGLAASAAVDRRPGRRTLALAAAVAAANAALLTAHLRARVTTPRVFLGAGLAAAALVGTVAGRRSAP